MSANLASATEYLFRREISCRAYPNSEHPVATGILCLDTSPGWKDPIIAYLKDRTLPNDKVEAQKLQHIATRYTLIGELMYKKSYSKFLNYTLTHT